MSAKKKVESSSQDRLKEFLDAHPVNKRDFANMLGVSSAYLYSLLDPEKEFTSRQTTLERLGVLMDAEPSTFPEYRGEAKQIQDSGVQYLRTMQQQKGIITLDLLMRLPKSLHSDFVEMWSGNIPLFIDWHKLIQISSAVGVLPEEIFPYWKARIQQLLSEQGMDLAHNLILIDAMFEGVRGHLQKSGVITSPGS